jgi:hypothetical protein
MYTLLVVSTAVSFVGFVGISAFLVITLKQVGQLKSDLSTCNASLTTFSDIPDAESHKKALDAECQNLKSTSDEVKASVATLRDDKTKLESTIKQYRSAVGDFQSVAKLQEHLKKLKEVVGGYETAAALNARINSQKTELAQFASALDVAPTAKEMLGRVKYLENLIAELESEVESLEETKDLQQFGVYRPHYDYDHSEQYKAALGEIVEQRKRMVKEKQAVEIPPGITVAGDEREGRKLGEEYAKVMLRAFNGEADADILKAKYNNMEMLQKRMTKSREQVNKLGGTMQISISDEYLQHRLKELRLAYEWERKKQQEKEEQAYLKEQAREEENARREAEKAEREAAKREREEQQKLEEKERMLDELRRDFERKKQDLEGHVVLSKKQQEAVNAQLEQQKRDILELETYRDTLIVAVKEAHEKRQAAISLAQMTKRGYVYILSNIGSFGEGWFKIGMTRREDPNVRVRELSSASVPFPFDIHAMVLTNDAPALENRLHQYFSDRRVNKVNPRKEFFEVTISEIRQAIDEVYEPPVEFRQIVAEAAEFRETEAVRREELPTPARTCAQSKMRSASIG